MSTYFQNLLSYQIIQDQDRRKSNHHIREEARLDAIRHFENLMDSNQAAFETNQKTFSEGMTFLSQTYPHESEHLPLQNNFLSSKKQEDFEKQEKESAHRKSVEDQPSFQPQQTVGYVQSNTSDGNEEQDRNDEDHPSENQPRKKQNKKQSFSSDNSPALGIAPPPPSPPPLAPPPHSFTPPPGVRSLNQEKDSKGKIAFSPGNEGKKDASENFVKRDASHKVKDRGQEKFSEHSKIRKSDLPKQNVPALKLHHSNMMHPHKTSHSVENSVKRIEKADHAAEKANEEPKKKKFVGSSEGVPPSKLENTSSVQHADDKPKMHEEPQISTETLFQELGGAVTRLQTAGKTGNSILLHLHPDKLPGTTLELVSQPKGGVLINIHTTTQASLTIIQNNIASIHSFFFEKFLRFRPLEVKVTYSGGAKLAKKSEKESEKDSSDVQKEPDEREIADPVSNMA